MTAWRETRRLELSVGRRSGADVLGEEQGGASQCLDKLTSVQIRSLLAATGTPQASAMVGTAIGHTCCASTERVWCPLDYRSTAFAARR
jgi:hypothetical protein